MQQKSIMGIKMQPKWLKYNPIKKRSAAGTRAVQWKCCLRESGRTSRIWVSVLGLAF